MLLELGVRDFAIIDSLQLQLQPGLTVLTGETGAGKSIIIDAVSLLLGARAKTEMIRHGAENATVEALFDQRGKAPLAACLDEMGIAAEEELSVRRIISRSGKNRIYINGSIATLGQLQELAPHLVSIFGQHEYQQLQRSERHLALLDEFGGCRELLDTYQEAFRRLAEKRQRMRGFSRDARARRERLELIEFQHRELEEARLVRGEDEELHLERGRLANAERLSRATLGGFERLYAGDDAVVGRLDELAAELEALSRVDASLAPLAETLQGARYGLEDVAASLRVYGEGLSFEPGRLDEIEARLATLERLKRKYQQDLPSLIAGRDELGREIEELSGASGSTEALSAEIARWEEEVLRAGRALRQGRDEAADKLCASVTAELKDLAMERARLEFRLNELPEPGPLGLEEGELYFSANPGEPLLPLAKVASGGELSRLMLAVRRVAPDQQLASALIFDEVDAGVGGATATAIGEKLRRVADAAQVLCITHLPQVAAFAHHHLRVEKQVHEERTRTRLCPLTGEDRVEEMARMLGGARLTERTLAHARELVAQNATSV